MKLLVPLLLLATVQLSAAAPLTNDDECTGLTNTIYVQEMDMGSYTTARYHNGLYQNDNIALFLPLTPFNTVLDKINGRKGYAWYEAKCDNQSLASYPDLNFLVNNVKIVLKPVDYINLDVQWSTGWCMLKVTYSEEKAKTVDYLFPLLHVRSAL
ncbi:hypothetical protein M3Y94_00682900 [Aphelenchoides besseyi]|nr:hypothetical protein M3Y94_00682900 [Aphelenchoides besseyi]